MFRDKKFGNVVSVRVFSAYEMTLATYEKLFPVFGWIDWGPDYTVSVKK